MFRFDHVGLGINMTIRGAYEPPRPALTPFPLRSSWARTMTDAGATAHAVVSLGADIERLVRFASSETQGVLRKPEVDNLNLIYADGGTFTLETDLLVPLGSAAVLYTAYFEPGRAPSFPPFDPGGRYYYMDLSLYIKEQ